MEFIQDKESSNTYISSDNSWKYIEYSSDYILAKWSKEFKVWRYVCRFKYFISMLMTVYKKSVFDWEDINPNHYASLRYSSDRIIYSGEELDFKD